MIAARSKNEFRLTSTRTNAGFIGSVASENSKLSSRQDY